MLFHRRSREAKFAVEARAMVILEARLIPSRARQGCQSARGDALAAAYRKLPSGVKTLIREGAVSLYYKDSKIEK